MYVGQRLCLHLFVPFAVDSACEETVEFSSEVAAVVGAAARLVSSFQHLDFEPQETGLSWVELVVPVVQWPDR